MSIETLVLGIAIVAGGFAVLAIELTHPGAFLMVPAVTMIVAGFLLIFLPDTFLNSSIGPIAVAIAAAAAGIITIPYYRWVAPVHRPMSTTPTSLEGETAIVIAPVVPDTISGKVRVGSEVWSASSDAPIPAGTHVRVLGGEGVSLRVAPLPTPVPSAAERPRRRSP